MFFNYLLKANVGRKRRPNSISFVAWSYLIVGGCVVVVWSLKSCLGPAGIASLMAFIPVDFARFFFFWGGSFLQSTSWMAASVCFICDILQIYKLRKNLLLDIILYIICILFCVSYVFILELVL